MWGKLKEILQCSFAMYKQMSFKGASTTGKLIGIRLLSSKKSILKKINVSFIVPFSFSK